MILLSVSDIEEALLPFRSGRRLVLDKLVNRIVRAEGIAKPFLLLSRLFGRLKSADSILEKIKRKGITIRSSAELPQKVPDILGFRIIVETIAELRAIDLLLSDQFEVISRVDQIDSPSEFGGQGIEYSLQYHAGSVVYPFELQARTFLQHYWASRSFHLFYKKPREAALKYQDALLALSEALQRAESVAERLDEGRPPLAAAENCTCNAAPLRSRVHLVVVEPGERFAEHVVQPLSGDDQTDHAALVAQKMKLYTANPGSAIVECSCLNFLSFMLNESHVYVPANRIDRLML